MNDYNTHIEINASVESCFKAITEEIHKWWGKVDAPVIKVDDEFSIFFGKTEWRFKASHFEPFQKVEWICIYSNHVHNGLDNIKEEWLDTIVQWNIEKMENGAKISMEHKGLKQNLNCYEVCTKGWDFFINSSLKNYLNASLGMPYTE